MSSRIPDTGNRVRILITTNNVTHLLAHEACESQGEGIQPVSQPSQDKKETCCSGNDNKMTPPPKAKETWEKIAAETLRMPVET
ncbi:hypothetical protein MUK42_36453 [Musa troglodytarum]|uniref:Uncharacterized protein n=1 Tax=Musa troglodytarum TaxID=320322 RepID=A0A9E7EB10_9LILI|nr:hypothetical protein MUK42_36453 [Musa troglodytarum]